MGAALTGLVGVPIIIGKVFLAVDIARSVLYCFQLLFSGTRIITDPIVDVVFETSKDVFISSASTTLFGLPIWQAAQSTSRLKALAQPFIPHGRKAASLSEYLAFIGAQSFTAYQSYRSLCVEIASSDRMLERTLCMLIGYTVVISAVLVIALAGEAGLGRIPVGVAALVRKHGTFAKLAFFMSLELVVFPLGIGFVVDACTVPLFAEANLAARFGRLRQVPFSMLFNSWLIGTL